MAEPPLSEEYTVAGLDTDVRRDLRGLQKDTADSVARHLVAAGNLVDDDPELALAHARYARRRASRIAVVREAAGIAAYHAGEWTEALAELRAARRMGGGPVHLPVMADIERALGRPERAVDIARGPEASELGTAERIELAIVGAGARRDRGELDAAVIALQVPELDPARREPWSARLFYAYADNLLAAGRESDALQWFVHTVDADTAGVTDAAERIAVLTGEEPGDGTDDFEFGEEEIAALVEPRGAAQMRDGDMAEAAQTDVDPAADVDPATGDDSATGDDPATGDDRAAEVDAVADVEPAADVESVDAGGSVDAGDADPDDSPEPQTAGGAVRPGDDADQVSDEARAVSHAAADPAAGGAVPETAPDGTVPEEALPTRESASAAATVPAEEAVPAETGPEEETCTEVAAAAADDSVPDGTVPDATAPGEENVRDEEPVPHETAQVDEVRRPGDAPGESR
ncbi:MAG: hypothetical protein L0H64_20825 [Pseudonocardia sp.]|nr:hypothetical protein [Pseudonocardia sp.]